MGLLGKLDDVAAPRKYTGKGMGCGDARRPDNHRVENIFRGVRISHAAKADIEGFINQLWSGKVSSHYETIVCVG